jgi:hypothetical protein
MAVYKIMCLLGFVYNFFDVFIHCHFFRTLLVLLACVFDFDVHIFFI